MSDTKNLNEAADSGLRLTACSPSFWMLTTWWNTHKDERGTQWPAGYDTVFSDKHPADWLCETRAKYGSVMHVVSAIEISESQFLENKEL